MQSKVTQGRPTGVPNPQPDKQTNAAVSGTVVVSSSALPTGAATESTLGTIFTRQTDGNQKTQVTTSALPTGAATEATLGTIYTRQADGNQIAGIKYIDTVGGVHGFVHNTDGPQISSKDYLVGIAEGDVSGHTTWSKIGWNPAITTSFEDIWSYGGNYVFPTAAMTIEVASDSATADADLGTILYNATCDDGGTTTTLLDATYDWSAGTAAIGDILIVSKSGTTPEWGTITAVANGVLTFSGGLSSGGSCATARTYQVLDVSAATGAMAVKIDYLDASYNAKTEILILNTTTQVASINTDFFRINSFRVIACGTKATPTYAPAGNLTIRKATVAGVFYSYITAGFTRARNTVYTVPLGKTLYVNMWQAGAATANDTKVQTIRVMTMINREPATGFLTGNIFYPYTELLISNETVGIHFPIPTKLPAKTDIKVRAIGLTAFSGPVTSVLRGWLE